MATFPYGFPSAACAKVLVMLDFGKRGVVVIVCTGLILSIVIVLVLYSSSMKSLSHSDMNLAADALIMSLRRVLSSALSSAAYISLSHYSISAAIALSMS